MKTRLNHSCTVRSVRRRWAFSLVEVLMSMSVIGISTGALLSGVTHGVFTMRMTRDNLRATQILLEKVETLRLYNWDQINTSGFIPPSFQEKYDPKSTSAPGHTYYGYMWVLNAPLDGASYQNDMREVIVLVHWQTGKLWRSRWLVTHVARNGLQNYVYGW